MPPLTIILPPTPEVITLLENAPEGVEIEVKLTQATFLNNHKAIRWFDRFKEAVTAIEVKK